MKFGGLDGKAQNPQQPKAPVPKTIYNNSQQGKAQFKRPSDSATYDSHLKELKYENSLKWIPLC
jgi:negative regulator of sigma E activity